MFSVAPDVPVNRNASEIAERTRPNLKYLTVMSPVSKRSSVGPGHLLTSKFGPMIWGHKQSSTLKPLLEYA